MPAGSTTFSYHHLNLPDALERVLSRASQISAQVRAVRPEARAQATSTALSLETKLHEALRGDVLRGMRVLTPPWVLPRVRGIRVHPDAAHGAASDLPKDGREAMVLTEDGRLVWASYGARVAQIRPVEGIQAQDLPAIATTLQLALERHIARAEKTAMSYARTIELSKRLAAAIGFEF